MAQRKAAVFGAPEMSNFVTSICLLCAGGWLTL